MMRDLPVRKPTRLQGYDYSSAGMYFITICVQSMEQRFGVIEDGEVRLNAAGEMVNRTWQQNIDRYPGAALDMFVVMPDHMHAIVMLGTEPGIDTRETLSQIVQSFKSLTTVEYIRGVKSGSYPPFDRVLWQRGFNERVLRNDRELDIVRDYIEANPAMAQEKRDHLINLPPLP